MAGSTFGNIFRITTWGESHGEGIGVVADGVPAGLEISEEYIQRYLDRRKPGQSRFTTTRNESDTVKIMSGVFEGKTTGTPISMIVYNQTQRSSDYSDIAQCYRPGHADYTYDEKYGFRDYRGGGRASGRETIGRVAAGAIACKLLAELGITVTAYCQSIGDIEIDYNNFDINERDKNPVAMPDADAAKAAQELLTKKMEEKNSVGGVVECVVKNMKAGVGEPVFDKLDACLAKAIMSIGAVKGVEIGAGFEASKMTGSDDNDNFYMKDGTVMKNTNNAGGILGGISDGSDIVLRAAFKPTPSIFSAQDTINKSRENIKIEIKGRHDPIIASRAVVVVEAMTALTVLDLLLTGMTSTVDGIKKFFID